MLLTLMALKGQSGGGMGNMPSLVDFKYPLILFLIPATNYLVNAKLLLTWELRTDVVVAAVCLCHC